MADPASIDEQRDIAPVRPRDGGRADQPRCLDRSVCLAIERQQFGRQVDAIHRGGGVPQVAVARRRQVRAAVDAEREAHLRVGEGVLRDHGGDLPALRRRRTEELQSRLLATEEPLHRHGGPWRRAGAALTRHGAVA